jgi:hypothetical protein
VGCRPWVGSPVFLVHVSVVVMGRKREEEKKKRCVYVRAWMLPVVAGIDVLFRIVCVCVCACVRG